MTKLKKNLTAIVLTLFAALTLAAPLTGCNESSEVIIIEECAVDNDCGAGKKCVDKKCVAQQTDGDTTDNAEVADNADNSEVADSKETNPENEQVEPEQNQEIEQPVEAETEAEAETETDIDQCQKDEDCPNCDVCAELNGVKTCLPTPGPRTCASDADCPQEYVCVMGNGSRPQCSSQCVPKSEKSYKIHEWGVNTPAMTKGSEVSGGPARYWGAVPAKPVLYVYADEPMTIDVGVKFSSGMTTETWPMRENGAEINWQGINVSKGTCNTTPTPQPNGMSPEPDDKEIYQLPEWVIDSADCLTVGETVSKLLFYTGKLTEYVPPVTGHIAPHMTMETLPSIDFFLKNEAEFDVGKTLLVYRDAKSNCVDPSLCPVYEATIAFGVVDSIAAGQSVTKTLTLIDLKSDGEYQSVKLPNDWNQLSAEMEAMLKDEGLFDDEIKVFMKTWDDMFFGVLGDDTEFTIPGYENGAFILYMWPGSHEAMTLPLNLSPLPKELKRAIVQHQKIGSPLSSNNGMVYGVVTLEEYSGDEMPVYTGPAANAKVTALLGETEIAVATTDGDGKYAMEVPTGTYTIKATRYAWDEPGVKEGVVVGEKEQVEVNLILKSNAMVDKPNLYLYPTATTQIKVTLGLKDQCEVVKSEPLYTGMWDVTVEPSGLIDGKYTYLFYEAEIPHTYPMNDGWCVENAEVEKFFKETMLAYGFTDAETLDFTDYWSVSLPGALYYRVYPITDLAVLDSMVGLNVSPTPDMLFRLWFVIAPRNESCCDMAPPQITPMQRTGFSAVEWGVIIN